MIKVIAFDIGGVLVDYNYQMYYNYLSRKHKINKRIFFKELEKLNSKIDGGEISLSELEARFGNSLGISKSRVEYNRCFENLAKVDKGAVSIAERLSSKYKLAILSDINSGRYKFIKDKLIDVKLFDQIFLSFRIHSTKPNKKMYTYMIKKLGVKPNEILFIDNIRENIEAARKLGINGILFKNARQLRSETKAFLQFREI